jgi:hypothetical protein
VCVAQLPWWDQAKADQAKYRAVLAADPAALFTAAKQGDTPTVAGLLEHCAGCTAADKQGDNGYTALHHTAFNGHLAATQALLRRGADIHAKEKVSAWPGQ